MHLVDVRHALSCYRFRHYVRLWHMRDEVLVASKVRYGVELSAAPHLGGASGIGAERKLMLEIRGFRFCLLSGP